MTTVCSGFPPRARSTYGLRFVQAFERYWPPEVGLRVYTEEPETLARGSYRSLWSIPGAVEFADRHMNNRKTTGRDPSTGRWKHSEVARGYSFKWDAFKFFKQLIIPNAVAQEMSDGDILVWLDGDVETTDQVPHNWVETLIGDADVVFLRRDGTHSEIGFWAVRLNDKTRAFLAECARLYTSDDFLALGQWHSAFVWDHARQAAGLVERSLTPKGAGGHVWPYTALARYTRHDKGVRVAK